LSSDVLSWSGSDESNSGSSSDSTDNTEVCLFSSEPSDSSGVLVEVEVVSLVQLSEGSDGITHDDLLGAVQDHELAVWSEA